MKLIMMQKYAVVAKLIQYPLQYKETTVADFTLAIVYVVSLNKEVHS